MKININKIIKITGFAIIPSLLFTGCSFSSPKPVAKKRVIEKMVPLKIKTQDYKVLKDNNLGQRAVVDMGVVLKTNITAYKDRHGNLIASHDVFFWAKRPDFITTNTLPKKRGKKYYYNGFKINLSSKGVIDVDKSISQETIRNENNYNNDKKILEFLKKRDRKKKRWLEQKYQ